MNKKGFTLVEIIVTIALLSVVLIFMLNTIIKLREQEEDAIVDKELLIDQSIVSYNINKDIISHNGISSFGDCNTNTCTINLSDGSTRILSISANKKTLSYANGSVKLLDRTLSENYLFKSINHEINTYTNGKLIKLVINLENAEIIQSTTNEIEGSTIYYEGYTTGDANKYKIDIYSYLKN